MKVRVRVKRKIVPVFFAIDDKYTKYLAVSLKSLMANANVKNYKYDIHILNGGITEVTKGLISNLIDEPKNFRIFFDDVREAYEQIKKNLPIRDYYSINTYFRFFIPTNFPQYDKAIYIDSDTVVLKSISKLFKYNIKRYYVAAVVDRVVAQTDILRDYTIKALGLNYNHYFNAGVMLMNTKKLREIKILDKFIELAKIHQFKVAQDQDYLNVLCKGHVRYIDNRYNCQTFKDIPVEDNKIVIVHYNLGKKPWNDQYMPLGRYFWHYARRTDFYDELFNGLQSYVEPVNDSVNSIVELVNEELADENNYWQRARLAKLNEYRRQVIEKMEELEMEGKYDVDVEMDPPGKELLPYQIDYLRTSPLPRFKAWLSLRLATRFLEKALKEKKIIINGVKGEENIKGLPTGAILTCNHFNAFDSFVIQYAYFALGDKKRKLYRIIKEGNYTSFPGFYGFLMRNCYTLPLSSNKETMKKFLKSVKIILDNKNLVLIYPEQSMWYNYRKPRPLKSGGYGLAVRSNVPIIPCFITMVDTEKFDDEGYPIQGFTLNILKPIYPKPELSTKENVEYMMKENEKAWKECYEDFYHEKLDK